MESILTIIFSFLLGCVALASGLGVIRTSRKVKRWPTTAGTVTQRAVVLAAAATGASTGTRHQATVTYTYAVAGQAYTSNQIIAYGTITGSHAAMQRVVDGLGASVTVHYNPQHPAEACLQPEPAWWAFGALAGAALCFAVGLVTLITR